MDNDMNEFLAQAKDKISVKISEKLEEKCLEILFDHQDTALT